MKALASAVLLLALAGCGSSVAASRRAPPASTPTATATEWKIDPSFNATDLAWIELMIPMDDQLLRVLGMAEKQASDPAVRTFATQVASRPPDRADHVIATRTRSGHRSETRTRATTCPA